MQITRGPYLQKATQESMIIRWTTDTVTSSKISIGFDMGTPLFSLTDSEELLEHKMLVTALLPNTKYYYTIENIDSIIYQDSTLFFKTLPEKGFVQDYSFFVIGDAGQGSQAQRNVSLAFQEKYGIHHDGVILLGDNAYWSGTQEEYQNNFFDGFYNEIFENTVIWPAPGNHDYYGASIPMTPTAPYFDIFDIPTNAECGGLESNSTQYYSFDYGNIHFVSLDSYAVDRDAHAEMANWLRTDLDSNDLAWTIAFWHHPPYSKGSHDSDNQTGVDLELVEMRENIVPILEDYNVDLVLSGHSHSYERSKLIAGHYGYSTSFSGSHLRSKYSGNELLDCAYYKFSDTTNVNSKGSVYAVVGVSGWLSDRCDDWPHPVMHSYSNQEYGALRIEVDGNKMSAEFLTNESEVFDRFTIFKDVNFPESSIDCSKVFEDNWVLLSNPSLHSINLRKLGYYHKAEDFFQIIDIQGKEIAQIPLYEINSINLDEIKSGMYIIRVFEGQNKQEIKFVRV